MIWLGLGSNIGDRQVHIHNAFASLSSVLESIVQAPLYETTPQDYLLQHDFLNTVVRGRTSLSPPELFMKIRKIEENIGRRRAMYPPKGPRVIDVDILMWDDQVLHIAGCEGNELLIPHPSMGKRHFVLKPLLDINPNLIDPRDGIPFSVKIRGLADQSVKIHENE